MSDRLRNSIRRAMRLSPIGDDLEAVTRIDHDSEVAPEATGIASADLDRIWHNVEDLYRTGTQPGIQLCLRHKGQILLNRSIGHSHGNGPLDASNMPKRVMQPDTPVCLFSASKAVTALLVHMLVEDGKINLLDPVSFYCPEFGQHGKEKITVHQVLSHRAGIPGIPNNTREDILWDSKTIWKLLCEAEPIAVDGGHLAYHAVTGGYVLEKVIEAATGESIEAYIDRKLRQPMRMHNFTYGIELERFDEIATNYMTGPTPPFPLSWLIRRALGADIYTVERLCNDPRFQDAVIPAGNIASTAEEIGRFFQMMLDQGRWQDQQVCSPLTIRRATQQYGGLHIDRTMMVPMRYSAGLMLGGDPAGIWGMNTEGAFGHMGLLTKLCWADPRRELSVALLTTGNAIIGTHFIPLIRILGAINNSVAIEATAEENRALQSESLPS